MIELSDVSVGYTNCVILKNVNAVFPNGHVTVILGTNGCGKTTLLKAVMGLIPICSGEIRYDGFPISLMSNSEIARKASYMAQHRNTPNIRAQYMVLHGRFPYLPFPRRYSKHDFEIVRGALKRADALDLSDMPMPTLSGGQRQRVYLAMTLAQQTQAVFMDEPTTFLDIRHQLEVMRMAHDLANQGKAVVLVSHDLCLALREGDQLLVLNNGGISVCGTPDEVFLSGKLEEVFRVKLSRILTETGWQYFATELIE